MSKILERMPKETKEEIIRVYTETKIKTSEICSMYNLSSGTLNDIIKEAQIPFRHPGQVGANRGKKSCRFCGSRLNPKGAKFCCECGKPLLTERENILNALEQLSNYFVVLEKDKRDKCIAEINTIVDKVKKLHIIED